MGTFIQLPITAIAEGLTAIGWSGAGGGGSVLIYSATAPTSPINGTLWYDTVSSVLKMYNGGSWSNINISQLDINNINSSVTAAQTAATTATNAKDTVLGMSVTATTLPSGSQATASYDVATGVLSLGLPLANPLVGSMATSVYDTTNNGVVDAAETVPWSGVSGKPSVYTPDTHTHTGTYEPADATILKSSSIGSTVQGYDVDTAKLDVVQTFTVAQRGSISTITYGATITPDFAVANNFHCSLTGNVIIANPTNIVAGQYGKLSISQDATGGRTVAFGTYYKFAGGVIPTNVTTANAKTSFYYEVASTTEITVSTISDWK